MGQNNPPFYSTAMEYAMNFDGISQQLATARCEGWHDSHSYN